LITESSRRRENREMAADGPKSPSRGSSLACATPAGEELRPSLENAAMNSCWTRLCSLFVAALIAHGAGAAAALDALVGTWLTEDGSSRVVIAAGQGADGGTVYAGKVAWLKDPTRDGVAVHDANNPDAALRGRPILGLEIVSGFKAAPGGGWTGGTLYSPRAGKSYPAMLSLTADGRLQIEVKAGILSKTVYWTR
jgi:uncharacterized protein (DUF2147 family)